MPASRSSNHVVRRKAHPVARWFGGAEVGFFAVALAYAAVERARESRANLEVSSPLRS